MMRCGVLCVFEMRADVAQASFVMKMISVF